MAWQVIALLLLAVDLTGFLLTYITSWNDDAFSQWVSAQYNGFRGYLAMNDYFDLDMFDSFKWCAGFFILILLVYKVSLLIRNLDDVTDVSKGSADNPVCLFPGFLRCRTSVHNSVEGVLCWVLDTLATIPSSSLLPSEVFFVPGSFPEDNSEEIAVVEGGVVQVNEGLEDVAVEVQKLAIVAPVSTIEIAAQIVVHAEEPATDKVALLEGQKTGLERDLALATVRTKDAEKATSALKLELDDVKAERDELKTKVGTLATEHDDEPTELNTPDTVNREVYDDLQTRLNTSTSQYEQLLEEGRRIWEERNRLWEDGTRLWADWNTRGQQLEALRETYNNQLRQMGIKEEELRVLGGRYDQQCQLTNTKEEELNILQESYNSEKQQKEVKEQELKALQAEQNSQSEQRKDYARLSFKADSQKNRIDQLTSKLDGTKQAGNELSKMFSDAQQKMAQQESEIADLRNKLTLATATKADVNATTMEVDTESDATATDLQAKDRLIAELRREMAQAKAEAKQLYSGQIDDLRMEKIMLECDLDTLRKKNKALGDSVTEFEKDCHEQHRNVVDANRQKELLEKRIEFLEDKLEGVEFELRMFKDGHDFDVEQQNEEIAAVKEEYEEEVKKERAKTSTLQTQMVANANQQEAERMWSNLDKSDTGNGMESEDSGVSEEE
ncbi:hypothetical protein PV11_08164 [Exophiala sideris]|uniref:Uncharacterized protein n=1 Tax=Exophiala sideris TaxID=1016849 RepID=A0A0D1YI17_9EURO|nr:hypothetical protein PV11_08164 [Exophiala sideris]